MANTRQIRLLSELRRFIQELDATKFESLSTGIGLGSLEPKEAQPRLETTPQMAAWKESPPNNNPTTRITGTMARDVRPPKGRNLRLWGDRVLAHCFDLMVVVSTVLIGMVVVDLFVKGSAFSFSARGLRSMAGAVFFRDLGTLKTLIVVYTIFVLYFLFFRIFAGVTIGENMVRGSRGPAARKS